MWTHEVDRPKNSNIFWEFYYFAILNYHTLTRFKHHHGLVRTVIKGIIPGRRGKVRQQQVLIQDIKDTLNTKCMKQGKWEEVNILSTENYESDVLPRTCYMIMLRSGLTIKKQLTGTSHPWNLICFQSCVRRIIHIIWGGKEDEEVYQCIHLAKNLSWKYPQLDIINLTLLKFGLDDISLSHPTTNNCLYKWIWVTDKIVISYKIIIVMPLSLLKKKSTVKRWTFQADSDPRIWSG